VRAVALEIADEDPAELDRRHASPAAR
jgi:hypothetical protein